MAPWKCKNPQCESVLGLDEGFRLFVGGVIIEWTITVRCQCCKNLTTWDPTKRSRMPPPRPVQPVRS